MKSPGRPIVKKLVVAATALVYLTLGTTNLLGGNAAARANLALVATATTSYVSGHETINALNDGYTPHDSHDKRHGAYGNWPKKGTQWVEYTWSKPIHANAIEVYWFDDHNGVRLPKACRLMNYDG